MRRQVEPVALGIDRPVLRERPVPAAQGGLGSSVSRYGATSSTWNPKWLKPVGTSPSSFCWINARLTYPSVTKWLPSGSVWNNDIPNFDV